MSAAFWPPDRTIKLIKLRQEGLSAGLIAIQLGGVTRNAVLGKVFRLGLSTPRREGRYYPTQRRPRHVHRRVRLFRQDRELPMMEEPSLELPEADPGWQPITFTMLEPHHCKWPNGDPKHDSFHFCGRQRATVQVEGGTHLMPYCEYHCGIAYSSPSPKRRTSYLPFFVRAA